MGGDCTKEIIGVGRTVYTVLRSHPGWRKIQSRDLVWHETMRLSGRHCSHETVDRWCRRIQNTFGRFRVKDDRKRRAMVWRVVMRR